MEITLNWVTPALKVPSLNQIFKLKISQKEDHFSKATLLIDADASLPPQGTEGCLTEGTHLLFRGALVGLPTRVEGPFAEIELIAKPKNFLSQLKEVTQECRQPPYWDELWIRADQRGMIEERQDVRTAALYCDRKTGTISLSDWFEGRQTLCVDTQFFFDSLNVHIKNEPLKSCTIHVDAKWVQTLRGVCNVGQEIKRAFPHTKVSTYGKEALLQRWPVPNQSFGKTGISILKSELKEVKPLSKRFPQFSPQIHLKKEDASIKPFRVRRHWFKPTLWVSWLMKQRRKETLTLTLTHQIQSIFPGEGQDKVITTTLQDLLPHESFFPWNPNTAYQEGNEVVYHLTLYKAKEDHISGFTFEDEVEKWRRIKNIDSPLGYASRDSFFMTERGYIAADHALERAKYELAKSSRCLEVTFEAPWESLRDINTDTTVRIKDSRLPGGELKGKVTHYSLIADGQTGDRKGHVILLCAVGADVSERKLLPSKPFYAGEDYCAEDYQVYENGARSTRSGLEYLRYEDQVIPKVVSPHRLVRHVEVLHGPEDQEREILNSANQTVGSLTKRLSQQATRIRVYFRDLKTKERIDHTITLMPLRPWSAPRQVNL